jgi:hypothetical protein
MRPRRERSLRIGTLGKDFAPERADTSRIHFSSNRSQTMPRVVQAVFLASAILAGAACDDKGVTTPLPTPVVDHPTARSLSTSTAVQAVQVLKRSAPLPTALSATATIGPEGGTIEIGRAGLRVTFARGAVAKPTRITLTANSGDVVAYEFLPHGLRFAAPVIVRQDLHGTAAQRDHALAASLQGSYFEGELAANFVGTTGKYARIKESRKAALKSSKRYLEFSIEHFSGYLTSSGLVSIDVSVEIGVR